MLQPKEDTPRLPGCSYNAISLSGPLKSLALCMYCPPRDPFTDFERPREWNHDLLAKSAAAGHEAVVRLLLQHRKTLRLPDYEIGVAFSRAAMNGHLCVVVAFLDLEDISPHICRALACAISCGPESTVEALFPPLTYISVPDLRRAVEIGMEAASNDDREARLKLVMVLGSLHYQHDILTKLCSQVLILAARHQAFQVLDSLMSSILPLDEDDVNISFDEACESGQGSVVTSLLRLRRYDEHHLYTAAGHGHEAVVRVLIERECSKTIAERALVLAAANSHTETVKYLVGYGTDINCTALLIGVGPGQPSRVSPLQAGLRGYLQFYNRCHQQSWMKFFGADSGDRFAISVS